jgi:predicted TIM-barrel fold metal-dependent hydrolase
MPEAIIDPDLPIIDPHHHLWDRRPVMHLIPPPQHPFEQISHRKGHYLLDELLADTGSGHNIAATVYLECRSMYRASGPDHLKPVGETEFVNGVAAMSASGLYGKTLACAGIVSAAELLLGSAVGEVLDAHIAAGNGRFKGIRRSTSYDADTAVLGPLNRNPAAVMMEPKFREGFAELGKRGLSFDAWLLEPQLPEVIDLARHFPGTPIVLDHVGTPLGLGAYAGKLPERFPVWRENIRELAKCQNVHVKLGGLAMPFCNFPSMLSDMSDSGRAPSEQLAKEWGPYIETCIEAFGARRAMFESNFPVDEVSCDYPTLWNALKLIAKGASKDEKHELFYGTANRFYRLGL